MEDVELGLSYIDFGLPVYSRQRYLSGQLESSHNTRGQGKDQNKTGYSSECDHEEGGVVWKEAGA